MGKTALTIVPLTALAFSMHPLKPATGKLIPIEVCVLQRISKSSIGPVLRLGLMDCQQGYPFWRV